MLHVVPRAGKPFGRGGYRKYKMTPGQPASTFLLLITQLEGHPAGFKQLQAQEIYFIFRPRGFL